MCARVAFLKEGCDIQFLEGSRRQVNVNCVKLNIP